jgi:hypothetical protein
MQLAILKHVDRMSSEKKKKSRRSVSLSRALGDNLQFFQGNRHQDIVSGAAEGDGALPQPPAHPCFRALQSRQLRRAR